jgi:hypothetical protein
VSYKTWKELTIRGGARILTREGEADLKIWKYPKYMLFSNFNILAIFDYLLRGLDSSN